MENYLISYVNSDKNSKFINGKLDKSIDLSCCESTNDLFQSLYDSNFESDLIILDIDEINKIDGSDIFDIVNSLATLINCGNFNKPKIAVAARTTTDPKMIKLLLGININGIYPIGEGFLYDEQYLAICRLIKESNYVPEKIKKITHSPNRNPKIVNKLTPRQEQIFNLIRNRGVSNKMIAKLLNISESTVKIHITQILKKCGVRNRTQLAVFGK